QEDSRFVDGVCFVPLGGIAPPISGQIMAQNETQQAILIEMAAALNLPPGSRVDLQEQVTSYLRTHTLLIIFDNFEHVLDAKPLVTRLMQQTPNCTFLVTSRNRLQLQGETVLQIDPLPVPEPDALDRQLRRDLARGQRTDGDVKLDMPMDNVSTDNVSIDNVSTDNMTYAGVQLFLDRARRHNSRLAVYEEDFPSIATICAQTGGLPFALEMVAAWTEHMTLAEIAEELRQNRALLINESAGVNAGGVTNMAWHETVDALIEHSWHLLSTQEQGILLQLALFASTFDYAAAKTIVGVSRPQLKRLTDSSLLQTAQPGRYTLHPLTQAFLRDQWQKTYADDSPETIDFWQRYCHYFLTFVVEQSARLDSVETVAAMTHLRRAQDNIELAWQQAQQHRWVALLAQVFNPLVHFYTLGGAYQEIFIQCQHLQETLEQIDMLAFNIRVVRMETHQKLSQASEGLRVGRSIQQHDSLPSSQEVSNLRVRYYLAMAYLSILSGDLDAIRHNMNLAGQALSAASPTALYGRYHMLRAYYTSFYDSNVVLGLEYGEQALDYYRQSGNRWREAEMLYEMGLLLASYRRGNERVMVYLQEALRIRQQLHDREGEAETLTILGKTMHGATNTQRISYLQAAISIHRQLGHRYREIYTLAALSSEYIGLGQYAQVQQWLEPLMTDDEVAKDPNLRYLLLNNLSIAASLQGNAVRGQMLAQQMLDLHADIAHSQQLLGHMALGYAYVAGELLIEAQAAFEQALAQTAGPMHESLAMSPRVTVQPPELVEGGHSASTSSADGGGERLPPRTGLADVGYRHYVQKRRLAQIATAHETASILTEALRHVEWLYPRLETEIEDHYGREFFWPHWVCYQVLCVTKDPRAADLLAQTHAQLRQWADELTDDVLRRSFLKNVEVNRAILDEVEKLKVES
ncbi:MAG: hypothetical protein AAF639_38675, partial [Chloroflexota bacterium]